MQQEPHHAWKADRLALELPRTQRPGLIQHDTARFFSEPPNPGLWFAR